MKVTDLRENVCILCETLEQANAICKLMYEADLKWNNGKSYLDFNYCDIYGPKICYFPKDGQCSDLDYAIEKNYKIYKAEEFLIKVPK